MLGIGQRAPGQEILGAFRHVRNHFQQHDGFVEMIEIIGGKPGAGIDVGGTQLRRAGLSRRARQCLVSGDRIARLGAVEVIGRSVSRSGLKGTERIPILPRMCGRFVITSPPAALAADFRLSRAAEFPATV